MILCSACDSGQPAVAAGTAGYDGNHPWDGPVCYRCSYLPGGSEDAFLAVWASGVRSLASALAAPPGAAGAL